MIDNKIEKALREMTSAKGFFSEIRKVLWPKIILFPKEHQKSLVSSLETLEANLNRNVERLGSLVRSKNPVVGGVLQDLFGAQNLTATIKDLVTKNKAEFSAGNWITLSSKLEYLLSSLNRADTHLSEQQ